LSEGWLKNPYVAENYVVRYSRDVTEVEG